jgi:hypothetical protein
LAPVGELILLVYFVTVRAVKRGLHQSLLVGAAGENVGNLIMSGKKSLHLPRRFEARHDPLVWGFVYQWKS